MVLPKMSVWLMAWEMPWTAPDMLDATAATFRPCGGDVCAMHHTAVSTNLTVPRGRGFTDQATAGNYGIFDAA